MFISLSVFFITEKKENSKLKLHSCFFSCTCWTICEDCCMCLAYVSTAFIACYACIHSSYFLLWIIFCHCPLIHPHSPHLSPLHQCGDQIYNQETDLCYIGLPLCCHIMNHEQGLMKGLYTKGRRKVLLLL